MNLDALSDFLLVATHGGIAPASRASGRPRASLSRRVMELETNLGVRLFERGSRSIQMTQDGELLLSRTAGPFSEIAEVAETLREGRAMPRGRLRINVPTVFGQLLMGRLAAQFAMTYPEVELDVTLEDRPVDLVAEGYDIVIRLNPKPDSSLVGRCFARDLVLIVAAPSRCTAAGKPGPPGSEPLPVVIGTSMQNTPIWRIPAPNGRQYQTRVVLRLPSLPMVRDAALTGIGVAKLPRVLVADDLAAGRLVSWGPASGVAAEVWALHTSRRLASAKVKAFMQFLEVAFPGKWL